jgi:hypothetical protein
MYKQQVLKILMDVGERGMSAALLSKHVYNLNCTLFFQPDVDEIRRWVWQYLQRNAKSRKPLIERTGRHGFYRLNKRGVAYMRQQRLEAERNSIDEELNAQAPAPDNSPGLFDDAAPKYN